MTERSSKVQAIGAAASTLVDASDSYGCERSPILALACRAAEGKHSAKFSRKY